MASDGRRNSQYATPYQTPTQGRPAPGQPLGPPPQDRYAQVSQTPSRTNVGRPSLTRPYTPTYGAYGYHEQQYPTQHMHSSSPMQGVEMQYSSYVHEPSRPHGLQQSPTDQHYAAYAQSTMLPPVQHPSIYDSIPQFDQRQTAIEVMASQFSMPQYAQHSEQSNIGSGASGSSSHYHSSQAGQTSYPDTSSLTRRLQPPFTASSSDYSILDASETQAQQESEQTQQELDAGLRLYEGHLRRAFTLIISERLTEASEELLTATRWLLSSVVQLGLNFDDESKYEQRIEMWREFNHCWEALGQKQRTMTENALQARQQPVHLLNATTITAMIDELIDLCDQLEARGLVDYEMGVWEEQIISIFEICLDFLPPEQTIPRLGSTDSGRP